MTVSPVPSGYTSVTPYLIVNDANSALDWYAKAFGAREVMRLALPDRGIRHAEIDISGSRVMLADACPDFDAHAPGAYGGSPASLYLYVTDVDTVLQNAVAAGASIKHPVQDQCYGDRSGTVVDPFGHTWHVATHVEDVSLEEVRQRLTAKIA